MAPPALPWWQTGVIYEVYPRSFQDSDGDGVGDLLGIAARLDHFTTLGIDAVWIAPFYPSPMADYGYDVADYCGVDPLFGTMADFDALLDGAHARGLKLIVDLVPNHTSIAHPWFEESRSSRASARRRIAPDVPVAPGGGPPNNWLSVFGGPAWEYDPSTEQYYLHSFLVGQPDLNWRNPEVERAMFAAMRFWLDKGVDGFRIDVLWLLIKDDQFRDNPADPDWRDGVDIPYLRFKPVYSSDRPELMPRMARMRAMVDSYPGDRVLIGETYLPIKRLAAYYGERGEGVHLPFNFKLIQTPWNAGEVDAIVRRYEAALPAFAWPNWVIGNHDQPRAASRLGGRAQARAAAVLLLTLRGTPTLYYGEELGLEDVDIPEGQTHDPRAITEPGYGRDPERTPMPWTGDTKGGFTAGAPWLPLGPEHLALNVRAQTADPDSMLNLYRRLLALRCAEPALHSGAFIPLGVQGEVMGYLRQGEDGKRFLALVNFAESAGRFEQAGAGKVVLGTARVREGEAVSGPVQLGPHEALVVALDRM